MFTDKIVHDDHHVIAAQDPVPVRRSKRVRGTDVTGSRCSGPSNRAPGSLKRCIAAAEKKLTLSGGPDDTPLLDPGSSTRNASGASFPGLQQ
jgi:hypothetical protein